MTLYLPGLGTPLRPDTGSARTTSLFASTIQTHCKLFLYTTRRPEPELSGSNGGLRRVYGGNRNARVGYSADVSAAVATGTTALELVELEFGIVVLVVVSVAPETIAGDAQIETTATTQTAQTNLFITT